MSPEPEVIPDRPMSPSEASGLKRLVIPAFVFKAVNTVLAMESFEPKDGTFDPSRKVFDGVSFADLERFARIVAYKVGHNIQLGRKLDPFTNPLIFVACEDHPCLPLEGE